MHLKQILLNVVLFSSITAFADQRIVFGDRLQAYLKKVQEEPQKEQLKEQLREEIKKERHLNDCVSRLDDLIKKAKDKIDPQAIMQIMKDCINSATNKNGFKKESEFFQAVAMNSEDIRVKAICASNALELVNQERMKSIAKYDSTIFQLSLLLFSLQQAAQEESAQQPS